jgi:2'-5' RNA ligase
MRLFFASWPPPELAHALSRWARETQSGCGGKVTRENLIHLTLAFLGDADPAAAIATAHNARVGATSFRLEIAKYWAHNRIVWVGPREVPRELAALARSLGETREFAAHITLIRKARGPGHLPPLPALEWPVTEFALMNSRLEPDGPVYEVLERFALAPPAPAS